MKNITKQQQTSGGLFGPQGQSGQGSHGIFGKSQPHLFPQ